MPQSTAQRRALLVQRRRDLGLIRTEVWVHPDDADLLRRFAAMLNERRGLPPASKPA